MSKGNVLNEAQLSILRLLGSMKNVEEVIELRQVICDYYARRVDEKVDKLWDSGEWNNDKNEAILKEHLISETACTETERISRTTPV